MQCRGTVAIRGRRPTARRTSTPGSRDLCRGQSWRCGDRAAGRIRNRHAGEQAANPMCSGWVAEDQRPLELAGCPSQAPLEGCSPCPERCCASHSHWNGTRGTNFPWKHTQKRAALRPKHRSATRPCQTSGLTFEHSQTIADSATAAECSNPSEQGHHWVTRTTTPSYPSHRLKLPRNLKATGEWCELPEYRDQDAVRSGCNDYEFPA